MNLKINKEFLSNYNIKETSNEKGFWMYKKDFYNMTNDLSKRPKSHNIIYGMAIGSILTCFGIYGLSKISEKLNKSSKIDFDFSEEDY